MQVYPKKMSFIDGRQTVLVRGTIQPSFQGPVTKILEKRVDNSMGERLKSQARSQESSFPQ